MAITIHFETLSSGMKARLNPQYRFTMRDKFLEPKGAFDENRRNAEENIIEANFGLPMYDRMDQQGTSDAGSLREKAAV